MKYSTETSELLKARVKLVEEKRIEQIEECIRSKDFDQFSTIVMQDSNNFHAVCMDTYPPLFYLNQKSKEIIRLCTEYNRQKNKNCVAYSFDAGPNAFVLVEDEHLFEFLGLLKRFYFPNYDADRFFNQKLVKKFDLSQKTKLYNEMNSNAVPIKFSNSKDEDFIQHILHSKVGDDARVVLNNDLIQSLLDENGDPLDDEETLKSKQ